MVAVTSIIAPFTVEQRQTVMYFLLIFISMAAVVKSCIPFNGLRTFICITMVIGTFGGLAILPSLFEISAITAGMGKYLLSAAFAWNTRSFQQKEIVRGRGGAVENRFSVIF